MSDDAIVWEDPPPLPGNRGGRKKNDWRWLAAVLKEHPGKWAIAAKLRSQGAAAVSAQRIESYGPEVTTRGDRGAGVWTVYARWPEDAR